jgi:hypothetical protein
MKLLRIIDVGLDVVDYQLIIFSFFAFDILKKSWYNGTAEQLFIGSRKAYGQTRKKELYNILMEFDFPMQLFRLINMCLNDTHSNVHIVNIF